MGTHEEPHDIPTSSHGFPWEVGAHGNLPEIPWKTMRVPVENHMRSHGQPFRASRGFPIVSMGTDEETHGKLDRELNEASHGFPRSLMGTDDENHGNCHKKWASHGLPRVRMGTDTNSRSFTLPHELHGCVWAPLGTHGNSG